MKIANRWCRRIAGPLVILAAGILTPTAAWAGPPVTAPGDTLAAGGKAVAGGLGVLCCLVVVGAVVVATVMVIRRRRR